MRALLGREIDEDQAGFLNGRQMGALAHVLIADMLRRGLKNPTAREIVTAVGAHPLSVEATVYRQAARQRLASAAAIYFRYFVRTDWEFIGSEVAGDRCRYDLVWQDADGIVFVDELKSGRGDAREHVDAAKEQIARELANGSTHWERFGGVRLLWLGAPGKSRLHLPDGSQSLIAKAVQG